MTAWTSQLNLDCPPPLACRYSDAALAAYAPGAQVSLGRIARPDEITTVVTDTLHPIAGDFRIKGEQAIRYKVRSRTRSAERRVG